MRRSMLVLALTAVLALFGGTDGYSYLCKDLNLAEQTNSPKVRGYACYRLALTCGHLGYIDEAVKYGERARDLSADPRADLPLHRVAHGLIVAYWYRGDIRKLRELGTELMEEGRKGSDPRSLAMGEMALGASGFSAGDFQLAIDGFKAALQTAIDPFHIQMSRVLLGYAHLANGQYQEALSLSQEVMSFSEKYGLEFMGTPALGFVGYALIATGALNKGFDLVGRAEEIFRRTNHRFAYASLQMFYGQMYLRIVEGKGPKSLSFMAKNIRSTDADFQGSALSFQ